MVETNPMTFEHGDPWRYVNRHGAAQLYAVDRTEQGPPGIAAFLTCLGPPHGPVEGYFGGESREAALLAHVGMRQRPVPGVAGWLPGHA